MLDQNTDRMWYVIGAVIIGAAIILILNNTFPQLFASVGETFKGKTEQTTEVVDGIGPVNRDEVPFDMVDLHQWLSGMSFSRPSMTAVQFTPDDSYMGGVYFSESYFDIGETYTIAFDIQKVSGTILGIGGHLHMSDDVAVTIDGQSTSLWKDGMISELNTDTTVSSNDWSKTVNYPNDTKKHHIELIFTRTSTAIDNNNRVYIQPNRTYLSGYATHALEYEALIEDVTLYEHN